MRPMSTTLGRTRTHLARIAVLLLCFALFAMPAAARTTITIGFWDFGPDNAPLYARIAEYFNSIQDDILLVPEPIPGNIRESVLLRWGTGVAPDLVWWYGPWYPSMSERGGFLDLTQFIERESDFDLGDFYAPYIEPMRWKGGLYGLPTTGEASVLYFNRDHFTSAGLGDPTDEWDWNSMLDAAKKLTIGNDEQITRYGLAAFFGPWEGSHSLTLIRSNGGQFFDRYELPTRATVTDPKVVDSIQWIASLLHEHNVVPRREVYDQNRALVGEPFFIQGTASMTIAHRAPIRALRETAFFDWDVAPQPRGSAGRSNFLQTSGFAIMSSTEHPNEAWEVLKFLVSPEVMGMMIGNGGSLPTRISLAPRVLEDTPPQNAAAFLEGMQVAQQGVARAVNQEELEELFYQALYTALLGQQPAASAMQQLEPVLNAKIAEAQAR